MDTLLADLKQKPLIFVGGKGGVGKTTHAASLACRLAAQRHRTLLISTDPAHSLGDVLDTPLSDVARLLNPFLSVLELDPGNMVEQHFTQVEQIIAGYARPEMMSKLRTFLQAARSSPGAEEAAMLEAICQHIVSHRARGFEHLVFDTAPTGHTLRLLELPQMMRTWTDTLLKQQQKQQELRDAALPLWEKAQSERTVMNEERNQRWQKAADVLRARQQLFTQAAGLLADAVHTSIVLVMTPEMLPLAETRRTVEQLKHFHLPCRHLIINRVIPVPADDDPFWHRRHDRQQLILSRIRSDLAGLQHHLYTLQPDDIRGIDALIRFGESGRIPWSPPVAPTAGEHGRP
ncbi:MAG: ArsA family ATPase [Lautropia sp.]|nr:ArsA family ATPase [Lautropia sp.]